MSKQEKKNVKQERLGLVLIPVKRSKTGAYSFKKRMLPKEEALALLGQYVK